MRVLSRLLQYGHLALSALPLVLAALQVRAAEEPWEGAAVQSRTLHRASPYGATAPK